MTAPSRDDLNISIEKMRTNAHRRFPILRVCMKLDAPLGAKKRNDFSHARMARA
jgi:hypothetical protein